MPASIGLPTQELHERLALVILHVTWPDRFVHACPDRDAKKGGRDHSRNLSNR